MSEGRLAAAWRIASSRLPRRSAWGVARRLVARANAERDAQRYSVAAALYEEALALVPGAPRFHIQCGHLYKEAGDFRTAGYHYDEALKRLPDDPDLAIQIGHFHKVCGDTEAAALHYARAAALRPGWEEAETELAGVRSGPASGEDITASVPELLPGTAMTGGGPLRDGFQVRRLGANRALARGGYRRVLRGVEAIRGYVVATTDLGEITLAINDRVVARERLRAHPLLGGQIKYVFNLWHDFSATPPGQVQVDLRVTDGRGYSRIHQAVVDVLPPLGEAAAPAADTVVDPGPDDGRSLTERINARPSMVRPAARSLLPVAPAAILIQRVDQLGDLVSAVPALLRLRGHFPAARIVALVTSANADLARTLAMIDEVVVADFQEERVDGRKVMDAARQDALRRTLARYHFDLALDLGETGTSRPLLKLSGARFLYGFKDSAFPWLSAGFDLNSHDPGNHHEAAAHARKLEAFVEALVALGGAQAVIVPPATTNPAAALRHGIGAGRRYAVLHAGARLAYTRWPGFADLASLILARSDLSIIVMGDAPINGLPGGDRIVSLPHRLPFEEFDALLTHAAVFVGNDSGPKHLAALRGVPVVSLHMARLNWTEWGQVQTGTIISRRVPCAGCGIGGQPEECGKDYACLRLIRAEEVFDAVSALL